MSQSFEGFSQPTIDFLWDIRFNNHKQWFNDNRERYEAVLKEPVDLFAKEMRDRMAVLLKNPSLMTAVSRINRDIRFSKNKEPYRAKRWVVFKPIGERWQEKPCFFFEISPEGYSYGMGFYEAPPTCMAAFRAKIEANPAAFFSLIKPFQEQTTFLLTGEKYKKKFPYDGEPLIEDWYRRKSLAMIASKALGEELFSRKILDVLEEDFKLLIPLHHYLNLLVD